MRLEIILKIITETRKRKTIYSFEERRLEIILKTITETRKRKTIYSFEERGVNKYEISVRAEIVIIRDFFLLNISI